MGEVLKYNFHSLTILLRAISLSPVFLTRQIYMQSLNIRTYLLYGKCLNFPHFFAAYECINVLYLYLDEYYDKKLRQKGELFVFVHLYVCLYAHEAFMWHF